MASYAVTGASRGIGFGFIQALSSNKDNQVFAIIRNPSTATELETLAKSNPNVHIVIGDATSPDAMDKAAIEVGKVTGEKLDVLIANVGGGSEYDWKILGDVTADVAEFKAAIHDSLDTNLFSTFYTIHSFLPLIQAGDQKKIISISTGMADNELTLKAEIPFAAPYSMSKGALLTLIAKYATCYKNEDVKFLSLSPGWVKTKSGEAADAGVKAILPMFQKVYPEVQSQISVEDSIRMQLETIDKLTLEQSGQFLSHHGDKYWF